MKVRMMKMAEFLKSISPAIISLVIAVLGYVVAYLERKKLAIKVDSLEKILDDNATEYYVICPNCSEKIILSQVKIYAHNVAETEEHTDGNKN